MQGCLTQACAAEILGRVPQAAFSSSAMLPVLREACAQAGLASEDAQLLRLGENAYESFDGGKTWTVTGHIPGYEGWTDNTDPVGAFDGFGNYYEFNLAYQFFYNAAGTHNFNVGRPWEPNPVQPAEVVSMAVRPHGATKATDWITTHAGHPDFVATYDSVGNAPDKQWMTIDTIRRARTTTGSAPCGWTSTLRRRCRSCPTRTPGRTARTPTGRLRSGCRRLRTTRKVSPTSCRT
jgi:hypothetical protein